MGGSRWSADDYVASVNSKMDTHGTAFTYDKDIHDGKVAATVAATLDPSAMKANPLDPKGTPARVSRDSDAHPNSKGVVVVLDVTGSMGRVVRPIHAKLPTIMGLLTRKGYLEDPQILFAAVGDATCDKAPAQIGQFESGAEMEGDVSKFFIEGGGGGQDTESYELLMYFAARHTSMDCLEKRGEKGFCFIIGDEASYPKVSKDQVKRIFDFDIEADIPTVKIVAELKEKFHVFYILPTNASNGHNSHIINHWKELLGPERVLLMPDENAVGELIATQIGLVEGTTTPDATVKDMTDMGTDHGTAMVVANAASKTVAGVSMTKVAPGTLAPSDGGSGTERL